VGTGTSALEAAVKYLLENQHKHSIRLVIDLNKIVTYDLAPEIKH